MNINVTSNHENNINDTKMEWQTPVLYKEDWMNTLAGLDPGVETSASTAPSPS